MIDNKIFETLRDVYPEKNDIITSLQNEYISLNNSLNVLNIKEIDCSLARIDEITKEITDED